MQVRNLLWLATGAAMGVAAERCGAPDPTEAQLAQAKTFLAMEQEARLAGNMTTAATLTVNVYFHVVAASSTAAGGYLTAADVSAQLDALNAAYAPHGITFAQAGADWTVDADWAADGAELAMKTALRRGTYADLNVYLVSSMEHLGYCYFPAGTSGADETLVLDGCTVRSTTVPGGPEANYDEGLTAVHEVGHWFGLYHTFQGGCAVGDRVDDTPAEASAAAGCPIGRDTCAAAGVDPIHNYMDYTYDSCYEEFTPGQEARMYSQFNAYRASFQ